jgi:hypothetical protein
VLQRLACAMIGVMKPILARLAALAAFVFALPAAAEPTQVLVRVISQDAKFIGESMGSVRVTLREAVSGRVMAEGLTMGTTGDTPLIMQATGRSSVRSTPATAAFRATVDIAAPTLVNLEAEGPLGRPFSALKVISQRWLMPGADVTAGDGWVIEMPGLAITPQITRNGGAIRIDAKVELMCGCPITPGGLWAAEDYQVEASLWRGEQRLSQTALVFSAAPGGYAGALSAPTGEPARLVIFARNLKTGNSGMAQLSVP